MDDYSIIENNENYLCTYDREKIPAYILYTYSLNYAYF